MVQDHHNLQDGSSSSVTSSPLNSFALMSFSPTTLAVAGSTPGGGGGAISPYGVPSPWVRELKSDDRGLHLIHLLINCANHVAASNLDHANAFLDHISLLASPDGDAMQRIASYFTEALARRILRSWPGLYRALTTTARFPVPAVDFAHARKHFLDLCPFIRLAFLISNQAILETMEGEKMVHIIDLNASDPAQWVALFQALSARPGGPPHLRITGVNEHRELLNHTAAVLSEEAEKLDIPFQFNPIVSKLDSLEIESLRVKTGEALAINSVVQLHSLLACEDDSPGRSGGGAHHRKLPHTPTSGKNLSHLHRMVHMSSSHGGTFGEMLENDQHTNNGFLPSPDSASSSPFALAPSMRMENFLASLWGLSPKLMVVTEQESNHNGATMNERFMAALYFYATLFDCLESTVSRQSIERVRVEKMLFGEEIKNIIACDGMERRERHEKLEKWAQRMDIAGFGRVPLSYYGFLQAGRMLQGFGCDAYQVKEENGCFFICWQERPLFSVSAWTCRRFD